MQDILMKTSKTQYYNHKNNMPTLPPLDLSKFKKTPSQVDSKPPVTSPTDAMQGKKTLPPLDLSKFKIQAKTKSPIEALKPSALDTGKKIVKSIGSDLYKRG